MANEDPSISEQFEEVATQKGWDDTQKIMVLLDYIESIGEIEDFLDFIEDTGPRLDDAEEA